MPRTILLADDSVTIRKVVELTFCDTDIRVESVATGRDALARFAEIGPDLVLADVVMPEPAGYEICRAVKESGRPVPVLLLAGTFEPFDPVRAAACGCDGHLVKPFDARTLVARVEALLASAPRHEEAAAPSPCDADAQLESMLEDLADAAPTGDLPASPSDPAGDGAGAADAPPMATTPVVEETTLTEAGETAPEKPPSPSAAHPGPSPAATARLADEEIERVARLVVERLSEKVLREIAWDVVPDVAEAIVRERIRQLEREEHDAS